MEQRKLIKLGNSSFAVALPKKWIVKSGLKKGDNIFIEKNSNGEVIISSKFKKNGNNKKAIISIDGKDDQSIMREFISAYINGNSIFQFIGNINKDKNKYIKKLIQNYIGCEVTEEEKGNITVRDLFNFEEMNLENFSKRANNNIIEMFNILIESVKKTKLSAQELDNIEEADLDINKIYFFNSRIMNMGLDNPVFISTLKTESLSLFNNWWITFNIEHIGDYLKSMTKLIKTIKISKQSASKLIVLLTQTKKIHQDSIKAFYDRDKEKTLEVMKQGKVIWNKCGKLTKSSNKNLSLIAEKLKNVENSSYQIVKMILNLEN